MFLIVGALASIWAVNVYIFIKCGKKGLRADGRKTQ